MANIISHRRVLEVTIEFMWVGVFVCKVIFVSNPAAVEVELLFDKMADGVRKGVFP